MQISEGSCSSQIVAPSSSAPLLFNSSESSLIDDLMDLDQSDSRGQIGPNGAVGHQQARHSIPHTVFNSTRFSDRDSGVNSQENLSDVLSESMFGFNPPSNGNKEIEWLGLETGNELIDPFGL